ncbi:MAG: cellulase family glycosylhydrolase [Flavobacteriales bacterium]
MKKLFIAFSLFLISINTYAQTALYYGVNLAGAEFGSTFPGTYGTDYIYPSNSVINYYSTKGLKLIRLPIKWERIQPTMNAALNAAELSRLTAVIDYAQSKGMQIIPDLHNYCRRNINGSEKLIGSASVSVANIKDCWTRLAEALKTKTNIFGYDIMNEPHDMGSTSWFSIAQEIINGIRSTDTTTTIIVSGDSWSSAVRWMQYSNNLKNLTDISNNLVFQAHIYFDDDASGLYDESYDAEGAYPNIGVDRAKPFVDWLNANKLRGFVGEYGIPNNDSRWNVVLSNMLTYLKDNCVNGTYWAGGAWWGDYSLSVQPSSSVDKPQMATLLNFLTVPASNCPLLTSSHDINYDRVVNVFPNPATNELFIDGLAAQDHVQIFNLQGQMIQHLLSQQQTIDISALPVGMYFICINSGQNIKFIKN